ncbi:McrB family protein, partial [Chloroflexota bacterium]
LKDQISKPTIPIISTQAAIEGLPVYEIIAMALYHDGKSKTLSVQEIVDSEFMQARFLLRPIKAKSEVVWGNLQTHTDPNLPNVNVSRWSEPFLFVKDDKSRWGLTDDGITYVEDNLVGRIGLIESGQSGEQSDIKQFLYWTTFHQNYSYEDFIEGLRPKTSEDDPNAITYEIELGIFRRVCALAKEDPESLYVLIVDEINRGNIAKIFGELITLVEDDKRLGAENELEVTLPYSGDIFGVPNNLYVIGTMNTADRSIALLDVALRRRFSFIEIMPQAALLKGLLVEVEGAKVDLGHLLDYLNMKIKSHIDRNHQIGHSYFIDIAKLEPLERIDQLGYVWNSQIIPLLKEYYYSQNDKLAELLSPFLIEEEIQGEDEYTFSDSVEISHQSGDDLIFALQEMITKI